MRSDEEERGPVGTKRGPLRFSQKNIWLKLRNYPLYAEISWLRRGPRSALCRRYVYIVKNKVAHRIDVASLADDGSWIAVKGDLKAGMEVVTLGNYELSDGMQIREASN